MTFVTNNVKYYATVSAGSTTEQINGKPYTITAVPTSERITEILYMKLRV